MRDLVLIVVYLAVACADFWLAHKIRQDKTEASLMLSNCMYIASALTAIYLVSVLATNPVWGPISHVVCIALTTPLTFFLLWFFWAFIFGKIEHKHAVVLFMRVLAVVAIADMVCVLLNPIYGNVATYHFVEKQFAPHFVFEAHWAYATHLALCGFLFLVSFGAMLVKDLRTPKMYRSPYRQILLSGLFVLVIIAIYVLWFSDDSVDYTMLSYSILGFFIYYAGFIHGKRDALQQASYTIVAASNQPVIIFDWEGRLYSANEAARKVFPDLGSQDKLITYDEFMRVLNLEGLPRLKEDRTRFYWTPSVPDAQSFICDYQEIKDSAGRVMARSIILTNNTLSVDPLTGFLTEQYFNINASEFTETQNKPIIIAISDLNQLGLLNNVLGYARGDEAIALQASIMRKHLTGHTIFVRLHDAKLAAVCYGMPRQEVKTRLDRVNEELAAVMDFNMPLRVDYSAVTFEDGEDLSAAVDHAVSVLKTRKLLDENSSRSSTIDSLTQMLREIDSETEDHVRRTRILGDGLAFELGLSDYERDQLSLLCLFHDIGKVGIPLSILNKPGALTDEERAVMHEHVLKGYRIARATAGLEIVAEPILHHHENWDGSGYPDGLQREAIPILSRIISVVDSYDAMVSDRPYHAGIPVDDACKELMRCAGTQFDPYIVEVFVRLVSKKSVLDSPDTAEIEQAANEEPQNPATLQRMPAPSKTVMISEILHSQYILDANMRIIHVDDTFEVLTGYTAYDVEHLQLTQSDMIFEEDRESYWALIAKYAPSGIAYLEHRLRRKDGTGCYVSCLGREEEFEGQPCTRIIVADLTDSMSSQHQAGLARNRALMSLRRLENSVQQDPMTKLLNRAAFRRDSERELLDNDQRCVLVMMDLDDFKTYNDTYGHPKGDELLTKFAQTLQEAVGSKGICGRMGGDEFACLLCYDVSLTLSQLNEQIEQFWALLNEKLAALDDGVYKPSVSGGAATLHHGEADFDRLYEYADANLYNAKRAGKSQIYVMKHN